ncbi:MAG: SIS domain-containing protein [Spirochaetaceae bacterium]|nr:MAG: SIS domain-containing protein [Spirochaetaceae bacterium]
MDTDQILDDTILRHPTLAQCRADISAAYQTLAGTFRRGGRLLICGNGGSFSDAEHIAGELAKAFLLPRPLTGEQKARFCEAGDIGAALAKGLQRALPAIPLGTAGALSSAIANDNGQEFIYAQQVLAYGTAGDTLLAISTSGRSVNVVYAAQTAKTMGLTVVALTGKDAGPLGERSDITIRVPAEETLLVQELHLPVYHALCAMVEQEMFGGD